MKQLPLKYKTWVDLYDAVKCLSPSHNQIMITQEVSRKRGDASFMEIEHLYYTIDEIKINAFDELQEYRPEHKYLAPMLDIIDRGYEGRIPPELEARNVLTLLVYHHLLPKSK